jgi:amino acid permease
MAVHSLTRAGLTMLGTIIGAGVFGVPAVFSSFGILWGSLLYWIVAAGVFALHLLYAEMVLTRRTLMSHRFPGQLRIILGPWAERVATVSHPGHLVGASVAYVLLGGGFLAALAGMVGLPANVEVWKALFLLGGVATAVVGLGFVAKVEAAMTWVLIGLMLVCVVAFAAIADPSAFFAAHAFAPSAVGKAGVFVFAVYGLSIIVQVAELCGFQPVRTRRAVAVGSAGAALLIWLFGVFGFAAAGPERAIDAAQIGALLPRGWQALVPLVGFFAVATSFITIFEELKDVFHKEWHWSSPTSLVAAVAAVTAILVLTADATRVMSYVGGLFLGINGMLASLAGFTAFRQRAWWGWRVAPVACFALFATVFLLRALTVV